MVTHASLDLDALVCRSVIKAPEAAPAQVEEVLFDGAAAYTVTTVDNVLYLPELRLQVIEDRVVPEEAILEPWNLEFEQRNSWHGAGGRFRTRFDVREVNETVCILSNFYSHNFTHWLEELLKVTILERAGYAGRYVLSSMPPFASEFLRLLGIPGERINDEVREPTVFRSAVYTTAMHFDALVCPGAFLALRAALLASVADVRSPYAARLWLDRGPNVEFADRDLVNPEEVHACVERHGFERVDIGSLPLERQLAAARDAAVIAGAHGSAFAHCALMKERSTVIECFSPLYLNGAVFGICRALDHRYLLVVDSNSRYSPYPHGNRVHVNLQQLELAFRHLE